MKNILLVMASQGILAPPAEKPEHEQLWITTWSKLERFLPDLFAEVFPEEAKKPKGIATLAVGTGRKSAEAPAATAEEEVKENGTVEGETEKNGEK